MLVLSAILNWVGAKILGRVARFGVYVETIGTFGVFLALAIFGFHQHFGFIFYLPERRASREQPARPRLFGGSWWLRCRAQSPISRTSTSFTDSKRPATSPKRRSRRSAKFQKRCATRCSTVGLRRSSWCSAYCLRRPPAASERWSTAASMSASSAFCPAGCKTFFLGYGRHRVLRLRRPPFWAPAPAWRLRSLATERCRSASRIERQVVSATPSHAGERDPGGNDRPVSLLVARADQSEQTDSSALVRLSGARQRRLLRAGSSFATSGIYLSIFAHVHCSGRSLRTRFADRDRAASSRSAGGVSRSRSEARSTCCSCSSTSSGRARCRAAAPSSTMAG